jgi:hypothetical protein
MQAWPGWSVPFGRIFRTRRPPFKQGVGGHAHQKKTDGDAASAAASRKLPKVQFCDEAAQVRASVDRIHEQGLWV